MAKKIIPHELKDWSVIPDSSSFWDDVDLSRSDINFGIHNYNNSLYTSGFVGVGRLYGHNRNPLRSDGADHIAVISSKFGMDPWDMLEKVMSDDEYGLYVEELKKDGKFLFKVFYNQPFIRLSQDKSNDGEILYALSFINSCYSLCKKGLKKTMYYQEENFNSKVRGKIDIKKNIRMNTTHGRNERFYCKYIDFTEDNIENRILKATLIKCKAIVESRFEDDTEFSKQASFCLNAFKHVKLVKIRMSDFRAASVTGLYMYYKPILQQAKSILSQKYFSYKADNGTIIKKSIYTIPYMINMETVFEFYARIVLKETLDINNYYLEKYSSKKFTEQGVFDEHNALDGIHLMPYCIPDIIVRDKKTDQIVIVLDAKYKPNNRSVRSDSLQLLSYVLLTGTDRCGFVFPGTKTTIKQMRGKDNLSLNTPLLNELKYFELILGNIQDKTIIETLVK